MALLLPLLHWAGVTLNGKPRFISHKVFWDDFDKVTLGDRVVISVGVSLLTHDYSYTTLLIAAEECPETDIAIIRPIIIGNNVFIGLGSIIMPGTIIEDNVIVGVGSVVRGRVESGSIVIGNPAKPVKTLGEQLVKIKQNMDKYNMLQD